MEPKTKFKSGLLAVALGMTTTFTCVGGLLTYGVGTAVAQLPPVAQKAPETPQEPSTAVDRILTEARKALASKDLVSAERYLASLADKQITYREQDDRPEYIAPLVQQFKALQEMKQSGGDSEPYRRQYAQLLLWQADGFLRKGILDYAEQLALEAGKLQVVFNESDRQRGIEPETMLKKVADARLVRQYTARSTNTVADNASQMQLSLAARQEIERSLHILSQARSALNAGNLEQAELLAQRTLNPNLPDSFYPQGGETPSRLLAEIAARRQGLPIQTPHTPNTVPAVYNQGADQGRVQPVRGLEAPMPQSAQPNVQFAQPALGQPHPTQAPLQRTAPLSIQQPTPAPVLQQPSVVDQAIQNQRAVVQQIAAEIMQQISDAGRITSEKSDPESAMKILEQASIRVQEASIDPQSKSALLRNIDTAKEKTARYMQKHGAIIEQDQINMKVRADRIAEQEEKVAVEKQLKTLVEETNKCLQEGRYEDAVLLAKRAKTLAPDNPTSDLLELTTKMNMNVSIGKQIELAKADGVMDALRGVDMAAIAPNFNERSLIMGDKWNDVKRMRKGYGELLQTRPESEQKIFRRLEEPVQLSIERPIPLSQLVNLLQGQTGVPFFLDTNRLREIDVTPDTLVEINLPNEVKLKSALNLILQQHGLAYIVEHEVLKITSVQASKGRLIYQTYYIGDLVQEIPNFDGQTNPNNFEQAYRRGVNIAGAAALQHNPRAMFANAAWQTPTPPSLAGAGSISDDALAQMGVPISTGGGGMGPGSFNGTQQGAAGGGGAADFSVIIDLIQAVVSPDSWGGDGGEIMEYYGNMSLVIRQTEEVHAEIGNLLNQLRKLNDLQVTIEVRYIALSDNFFERIGVDFDINLPNGSARNRSVGTMTNRHDTSSSSNNNNNNNSSGSSSSNNNNNNNNSNQENMADWVSDKSKMKANNATVGLSAANVISANFDVPINQDSYSLSTPMFGGAGNAMSAGINAGVAILSDIEAYFFLTAAEGDVRSNVMQAPKVTIFNGQMGYIADTVSQPFVMSVIPVIGDFAAGYQPVITILNEGQMMSVQGVVSNNRQFVRLTLNPTFTKIVSKETFKYMGEDDFSETTDAKNKGDDNQTASTDEKTSSSTKRAVSSGITLQLPVVATIEVQTTVSVPDGGTILLGGIKRLQEGRNEYGTPILDKIPYLSRLFMNTSIGRETSSIMMMVTPRIVIQEEEEQALTGMRTSP